MSTMRNVAEAARVSVATVSHVLNGTKHVSAEVEKRVREAARKLGYRPNRTARALRTGKSEVLGLLFPDLANSFFPELAQAVERAARRLGYGLILVDTSGDKDAERGGFDLLSEHKVAGAIWIPVAVRQSLRQHSYPVVAVDRPQQGVDSVYCDHFEGGRLIAEHVAALGHRRVGLLSGPQELSSARLRREGFFAAAGTQFKVVWEEEVPFSSDLSDRTIERCRDSEVTMVVAANDLVAAGVLAGLRAAGKSVPDHLSLIGYDDLLWSAWISPALTTVRQNVQVLGETAVALWRERLLNPQGRPQTWKLPVTLVVRASSRRWP